METYNFILNIKSDYPPNDGSNYCAFLSVKNASEILFNHRNFFKTIKKSAENIIINWMIIFSADFLIKVNAYREFDKYYAPVLLSGFDSDATFL